MGFRSFLYSFIFGGVAVLVSLSAAQADPVPNQGRRQLLTSFSPSADEPGIRVAFFDVDGTLRPAARPGAPVNRPEQVFLLPHVAQKLNELAQRGFFIALISNQAGIPRFTSLEQTEKTLFRTVELLRASGGVVHMMDFAENRDEDRKPGIGMGQRVDAFLLNYFGRSIDRTHSLMVGDAGWMKASRIAAADVRPDGRPGFSHSNADRKFAEAFGVPFIEATDFFGWRERYQVDAFDSLDDLHKLYERVPSAQPDTQTLSCLQALLRSPET